MIRNKAEDVAGLTPGKDDNAVAGHLARRTPCNLNRNCCKRLLFCFVITTLLGACLHFLYTLLPNPVTAIFSPVSESLWEHLKLLFWPYLAAMVVMTRKGEKGCKGPWLLSLLLLSALMLLLSYGYHVILGQTAMAFDLSLYVLLMAAGFVLPGWFARPGIHGKSELLALLVVALGAFLVLFSFLPPDHILFVDLSNTNTWMTIPS